MYLESQMYFFSHTSGAGSSHQQVVGCSGQVDWEDQSDLWQIMLQDAAQVFHHYLLKLTFLLQDVFVVDSPLVFKHNSIVSVIRLGFVKGISSQQNLQSKWTGA